MRFGFCGICLAREYDFSADAVQFRLDPPLAVLFEQTESGLYCSKRCVDLTEPEFRARKVGAYERQQQLRAHGAKRPHARLHQFDACPRVAEQNESCPLKRRHYGVKISEALFCAKRQRFPKFGVGCMRFLPEEMDEADRGKSSREQERLWCIAHQGETFVGQSESLV